MDPNTIAIAGLTLIVGLVIGILAASRLLPAKQENRDLQKELTETRDRMDSYRGEVAEHFQQSAKMLEQLSDSYRDIHNHLAQGANTLLERPVTQGPLLQKIGDNHEPEVEVDTSNVAPPLDYAPKTGEKSGVLSEDFGLDKDATADEEELIIKPPVT